MSKLPEFFRHALVMLSGSVFAQLIPLITSPLLTRLYSPAEYGIFSSVLALAGVISVVASLRYDLAIVLPEKQRDAANLVALAVVAGIIISAVLFAVVILSSLEIVPLAVFRNMGAWAFAAPGLCLLIAWQQLLSFFANRIAAYKAIAVSSIVLQLVVAVFAIAIGVLVIERDQVNGLIVARLLGALAGIVALCLYLKNTWREYSPSVSWQGMSQVFFAYRQFPLINVPYSLLGIFSREFFVLALTAFNLLHVAGQYGLARMILNAPINFMTAALSQVFYREAAQNSNSQAFRDMTSRMLLLLALGVAPLLFWALYWAEEAFVIIFGAEWREAGSYAAMLMPVIICSLFTSWPERIFEVRQRQKLALMIQLLFDTASIGTIIFMLRNSGNIHDIIFYYVTIQLMYHFTYFSALIKLVGLRMNTLVKLITIIIAGFSYTYLIHILSTSTIASLPIRMLFEFFAISALAAFTLIFFKKNRQLLLAG